MKRGYVNIRKVHTNLCYSILFYKPSNSFHRFTSTRLNDFFTFIIFNLPSVFPNIKCNRIGAAYRRCIQIYIISHQKITYTNNTGSGNYIKFFGTIVRLPFRLFYFFKKPFVFAGPNYT